VGAETPLAGVSSAQAAERLTGPIVRRSRTPRRSLPHNGEPGRPVRLTLDLTGVPKRETARPRRMDRARGLPVRRLGRGFAEDEAAPECPASGFFRAGGIPKRGLRAVRPFFPHSPNYPALASPLNRSNLARWITLLPAHTILGPLASSRLGFAPMRTAWTIWSGSAGPLGLSVRPAGTREVGGWATGGFSAPGAVPVRR
jgi:hypothetical protein